MFDSEVFNPISSVSTYSLRLLLMTSIELIFYPNTRISYLRSFIMSSDCVFFYYDVVSSCFRVSIIPSDVCYFFSFYSIIFNISEHSFNEFLYPFSMVSNYYSNWLSIWWFTISLIPSMLMSLVLELTMLVTSSVRMYLLLTITTNYWLRSSSRLTWVTRVLICYNYWVRSRLVWNAFLTCWHSLLMIYYFY